VFGGKVLSNQPTSTPAVTNHCDRLLHSGHSFSYTTIPIPPQHTLAHRECVNNKHGHTRSESDRSNSIDYSSLSSRIFAFIWFRVSFVFKSNVPFFIPCSDSAVISAAQRALSHPIMSAPHSIKSFSIR
jgi:hypothetical protein